MEQKFAGVDTLNLIITTAVLLSIGSLLVFFLLQYQRKRYLHYQEMKELKDAFSQSLMQSKLEIQEQALSHIARELHDNISPLISIIQLNLGSPKLKKVLDIQPVISELKSNAGQLMTELKSLSVTLNTDHIMHRGFADALFEELDRIERTRQFRTVRTVTGEKYRLRPEHEIILFRMCQEILNNTIKHAQASTITVKIDYTTKDFFVSINDDGIGFNSAASNEDRAEQGSTGLLNIASRAKLINAAVKIDSAPGSGSTTTITVFSNNQP